MLEWQALGYSPDQFVKVVARGLTPEQAMREARDSILAEEGAHVIQWSIE